MSSNSEWGSWTWKDLATLAIAAYGALLSTVNWLSAAKDRRVRVKVHIMEGVAVGIGPMQGRQLSISATNFGRRPVTLTHCHLELRGAHPYLLMNNAMHVLPKELLEGQVLAFAQPVDNLFEGTLKTFDSLTLRPVWVISIGKSFRGDWITVLRRDPAS